jgi:hypothetical protein
MTLRAIAKAANTMTKIRKSAVVLGSNVQGDIA